MTTGEWVFVDSETETERAFVSWCRICFKGEAHGPHEVMLLSPSGVAHESSGYGVTDCGHDATGDDWWWRL